MLKKWFLVAMSVFLALLASGVFLVKGFLIKPKAELEIETNVGATVFVDGQEIGTTPLKQSLPAADIDLKLVPIAIEKPLAPWSSRLTLTQGVRTFISRDFGETEDASAGAVLTFEKIAGKKAELAVVSTPDNAQVKIDGTDRGFTPLQINDNSQGKHQIAALHPGYLEKTINGAKTIPGYRLRVVVYLARDRKDQEASTNGEEKSKEEKKPVVKILETGTSFLRVRESPSTASLEVAQVQPGKEYVFIEENQEKTWFKIEYEDEKTGWVKAEFAQKVEEVKTLQ